MNLRYQVFLWIGILVLLVPASALADDTPNPTTVTIPGSMQSALGCPGDWQPDCAITDLLYDGTCDVWTGIFNIPAGSWQYKAALNGSWAENYGLNAQRDGPNIPLNLPTTWAVKFYYDHKTHWVTDNWNSRIVTAPGSYQSEIGCAGDWDPACLCSWLQDPHAVGFCTWSSTDIPPGDYEVKIAINESWNENYGAGGVRGGPNIPFSVDEEQSTVNFYYDRSTHLLFIEVVPPPIQIDARSWGSLKGIYR